MLKPCLEQSWANILIVVKLKINESRVKKISLNLVELSLKTLKM